MRQIGTIDSDAQAERFSDYLLTQGIGNMVEESAGAGSAWAVWVEDDDHLDRARTELASFRANPGDARYDTTAAAARLRKDAERDERRRRKQFVDVRTRLSGAGAVSARTVPVTIVLVAASLLVGALTRLGMTGPTPVEDALLIAPLDTFNTGDTSLRAIRHGQIWRLVTPVFIHFGPWHLLFNMMWTALLGIMIEPRLGRLRFAGLVLVCAILPIVAEYYLGRSGVPNPRIGGMSGVVYGLFGYAWVAGRVRPELGVGVSQQTVVLMMVWLVVCMIPAIAPIPNVANVAHVTGLLCGAGAAYAPHALARARRRSG